MTQLLVSVRNAQEALVAANNGASVIDIKEPTQGAMGQASAKTVCEIVRALRSADSRSPQIPISIAMGELVELPDDGTCLELPPRVWNEIKFAKIGCRDCDSTEWRKRWSRWCQALPGNLLRIAVAYADDGVANSPQEELLTQLAIDCKAQGVLIDTFRKKSNSLFDSFSISRLESMIHQARAERMLVAVAGSLRIPLLSRVLSLEPDIVAVRGAACRGDRNGPIDASRVRQLAQRIVRNSLATNVVRHNRCLEQT